jgi:cytochrome c-type biogenesis protein
VTTPTVVAAFLAGLLTFASPCVLPLVPGYLAYMSGQIASPTGLESSRRTVAVALGFVCGFTVVFVTMGATISRVGTLLLSHRVLFERIAGTAIVVMALAVLGLTRLPMLNREFRPHPKPPPGIPGSALLGAAFALGWSPCVGPTLAAVLAVAAGQGDGSAPLGAALLAVYSLGLGSPLVLVAAAAARAGTVIRAMRRHGRAVNTASGLLLLALGVLMVTGQFSALSATASRGG